MIETRYSQWFNHPRLSIEERQQLQAYSPLQRSDAFFKEIEFGTAGMRGILGPGTNRINRFTIQKAAIAFGLYLKDMFPHRLKQGVVIAHDNRHAAHEFETLTSKVLNQMGISTYTFAELVPTPLLSYAVRHLHAIGGVMLTASHNPKEYNGFKVYDELGCQLVPQKIQLLLEKLTQLGDPLSLDIPLDQHPLTNHHVPDEVEHAYLKKVKQLQLQPQLNKADFPIVFSPQHGASYRILPSLFSELGYSLQVVPSQALPDPDFSGTLSPNPEEPLAYQAAIALAQSIQAPLVMVADPDADRVGLAYRTKQGDYALLNGNLSAALLLDYLLQQKQLLNKLPAQGVIYDTIVSSPLSRKIAFNYGMKVETFLTGFKFIGERIAFYENHAGPQFVFGYEESYGCLIGDFVRDKDAIQALLLYAEMALFYHQKQLTLGDALQRLYDQYGYHLDQQYAIQLQGEEGQLQLTTLMHQLRKTPFKPIGNTRVVKFEDFLHQQQKDDQGQVQPISLPPSDVVRFTFEDGNALIVRPSGTEPKCKFYYAIHGDSAAECEKKLSELQEQFNKLYLAFLKR